MTRPKSPIVQIIEFNIDANDFQTPAQILDCVKIAPAYMAMAHKPTEDKLMQMIRSICYHGVKSGEFEKKCERRNYSYRYSQFDDIFHYFLHQQHSR